jgi:RNA polymerase sigma-70 factor (ECF subfamily)
VFRRLSAIWRVEPRDIVADATDPDAAIDGRALADQLRAALGRLPSRQRQVLHLVFQEDMTVEAAAAVMGVSLGSARTHYARGKARLRELLQEGRS